MQRKTEDMDEDRRLALLRAMRLHGGGFAVALSAAWVRADATNDVKLMREFGDLLESFDRYTPATVR